MPDRRLLEVEAHTDRHIARRLTMAYVCGLLLIGLLTAGVHALLDHIILQQRDAATIINVAGRQRMLSQRIALLSGAIQAGDESARVPLRLAVLQMERAHQALVDGGDLGIARRLSPEMHAYFFDGPNALAPMVQTYLADARDYDNTGSPAALARVQLAARTDLLIILDRAVTLFESEANRQIERLRLVQTSLLAILLVALLLEATFIFRPLVNKVGQTATRLLDMATHDGMTGLVNHRFFMESAEEILSANRLAAEIQPVSILMLDLDYFKRVNDVFGHSVGDAVLVRVARVLQDSLRVGDLCARLGGEEFAVLLSATDTDSAVIVAEKLRAAIAAPPDDQGPAITVSIGVSSLASRADSLDHLKDRADRALYRAKSSGRNCVRVTCSHEPQTPGDIPAHVLGRSGTPAAGRDYS